MNDYQSRVSNYQICILNERIRELLQGSVTRLACALPLYLFNSITHDLDLKVTGGS